MTTSRFSTILKLRPVVYVAALAIGFTYFNAPGPRSVLLALAIVIALRLSLAVLVRFVPWSRNSGMQNLGISLAWIIGGVYYLIIGRSPWGLALAVLAIIMGIRGMASGLLWVVTDFLVFRSVLVAFRRRRLPIHGGIPVVYVLSEPGIDDSFITRLTGKATHALWKYRLVHGAEALPERVRAARPILLRATQSPNRSRAVFIRSNYLLSRSRTFRLWLAANASCVVIIRSPLGADSRSTKEFVVEMEQHCRRAAGPVIALSIKLPKMNWRPSYKSLGKSAECFNVDIGNLAQGPSDFIAPLVERLANTAVPSAMSDAALPDNLQPLIAKIGSSSIPPIADCYLRYRLSRSHVERFLALMDGFECLAKISVLGWVALAPDRRPTVAPHLERRNLSLGNWVDCLRRLAETRETVTPLDALYKFWETDVSDNQRRISEKVSKDKIWNVPGLAGARQIEWIRWIKDLRNASKGHGVVADESVRDLWHPLHEAFLYMVWGLAKFVVSSEFVVASAGAVVSLRGWRRDIADAFHENLPSDAFLSADLRCPGGMRGALGRSILVRRASVFIWDGAGAKDNQPEGVYLDYLTGERRSLPLGGTRVLADVAQPPDMQ